MSTSRTEAFSDGVFAIAATLLVLELKVPQVEPGGLASALLENWPSYATYVVSFLTIGLIWVNHQAVLDRIRDVTRPLLFMNLVFLMAVAAVPFPTALLADYLRAGHDESLAAAVYGGCMALMGLTFGIIWSYVVLSDNLLREEVDPARARRSLWIFTAGTPLYVLAIGCRY
ncbi:MAG: TMEM175 family protein [Actinomycetota bacterium]|nr:TMEM175 family protein [Actinomycetota bacterium]